MKSGKVYFEITSRVKSTGEYITFFVLIWSVNHEI